MKFVLNLCLIGLFSSLTGCTDKGQSSDCAAGGRGAQESEGCLTPIGGSCLTHDEFVRDRPTDPDADPPLVPEADWIEYKAERPECDFAAGGASGS